MNRDNEYRNYEALSALLDGETNDFETRRVLRDLDRNALETLGRWQFAGDTLRGQAGEPVPAGFNQRLSDALAAEAKPAGRRGMVGGFARVAVAASVAAATVIGWQYWNMPGAGGGDGGNPTVAANDSGRSGAQSAPAQRVSSQPRVTRPFGEASLVSQGMRPADPQAGQQRGASQSRVNAMLLRHSEFTARHSGQGMMPYARMVSMDARNGAR